MSARDEERTIGILLWKIRTVMGDFGRDYRVLVSDDGSTDETPRVLERYQSHVPVDVYRNDEPLGRARALEQLIGEAVERAPYPKRDMVVTIQADFTEHPGDVVEMVKVMEGGADVVAGVREPSGDASPRRVRIARRLAPLVMGGALRGAPVSDPLSGFRAYRIIVLKKAIRDADPEPLLTREGWAGQVELLERVVPHARRIEEVPFRHRYDIRRRSTRFRPVRSLAALLGVRGRQWTTEGAA